jgi:putative DNA primase/helicase
MTTPGTIVAMDEGLTAEIVATLAALPPAVYDQRRAGAAEQIGVRAATLDGMVKDARKQAPKADAGADELFPVVTPWHEPVNGAILLQDITDAVLRFIVCDISTAHATALWIVFTWLIDSVSVSPIAMITAPEMRCGKTQLLALIGRLAYRALSAANISAAAIYRCIEAWRPALLIDEADAFLRENEGARGILNSGHTRDTAFVVRVEGDEHTPKRFSTWGAKAIAGIGKQAGTLMDRSIPLALRRKLPHESAEKIRHADPGFFEGLASRIARFALDNADLVRASRPQPVGGISDRAEDNWEPLLAIADVAGGDWPAMARRAALVLSGEVQAAPGINTELLADIHDAFETRHSEKITTADLLEFLCADDEKPWATWNHGKPLSPHQLSKRLREYGIAPNTIRIGQRVAKGYELAKFQDAFKRYLTTTPPQQPEHRYNPAAARVSADSDAVTEDQALRTESPLKPSTGAGCNGVPALDHQSGRGKHSG